MTHAITSEEATPDSLWEVLLYYIQCIVPMFGSARAVAEKHTLSREEHFHLQGWLFRCEELFRRLLCIDALKRLDDMVGSRASAVGNRSAPIAEPPRPTAAFDPDTPETWQTSFRLISCGPPASSRHLPAHAEPCRPEAGGPRSSTRLQPLGPQRSEWVILASEPKVTTYADLMRSCAPPVEATAEARAANPVATRGPNEPRRVFDAYPLARRIEALERATQNRERHVLRMARLLARNIHEAVRFTLPTRSRQRLLTRPGDLAVEDASKLVAWMLRVILGPKSDSS